MNIKKLAEIFSEKFRSISEKLWDSDGPFEDKADELWAEYLNGIDCTIITWEDVKEDLEIIINDSSQGRVCIANPFSEERGYILVPKELAERAMVLGGLPESWFSPESSQVLR